MSTSTASPLPSPPPPEEDTPLGLPSPPIIPVTQQIRKKKKSKDKKSIKTKKVCQRERSPLIVIRPPPPPPPPPKPKKRYTNTPSSSSCSSSSSTSAQSSSSSSSSDSSSSSSDEGEVPPEPPAPAPIVIPPPLTTTSRRKHHKHKKATSSSPERNGNDEAHRKKKMKKEKKERRRLLAGAGPADMVPRKRDRPGHSHRTSQSFDHIERQRYKHRHNQRMPYHGPTSTTNLIVNYLPQTMSDYEFRELFGPYGEIQSSRIVRDRNTGYSFGYGFVNYTHPSSASIAIEQLNGAAMMNKTIKVSYARAPTADSRDTNLYITNLPRDMTEEDLVKLFSRFGKIIHKNILYDKYTQLPRGVGFVRYDKREDASVAIEEMNDFLPPGASEPIKVRLAENHGKHRANFVAGFQQGYHHLKRYY